jgi:hypothetical protein
MGRAGTPNQLEFSDAHGRQSGDTSEEPMRHLNILSIAMLLLGIGVFAAGAVLETGPVVTLVGMMLIVAAIVKIITVRIWNGFFDSDTVAGK